jgi:hypothetical protein
VSLQPCSKGEYLPLVYQPTTVHEEGFYLKAPDGQCFDGSQFRSCVGTGAQKLMWGIGMKYVRGEAQRYFFNFLASERNKCLIAKGSTVMKDVCSSNGALGWGLWNGQLSFNQGAKCLGRKANDEGILIPCKDGFEHISIEVPVGYTNSDALTSMYDDNKVRVSLHLSKHYSQFICFLMLSRSYLCHLQRRTVKKKVVKE